MKRPVWNIDEFDRVNLPLALAYHEIAFDPSNDPIRVLDMPIHMPSQGWKIPDFLTPLEPLILSMRNMEAEYDGFENHFVYITVDQKMVYPGKTGRRPGAHSDAYIESNRQQVDVIAENVDVITQEKDTISHTYVWADCIPTEFFRSRFPLIDGSCNGSLKTFNEIADNASVRTYPNNMLLMLTPYVVHRSAVYEGPDPIFRTFVKMSVSKKRYARKGNTLNPAFDYDWLMAARSPNERNHPW